MRKVGCVDNIGAVVSNLSRNISMSPYPWLIITADCSERYRTELITQYVFMGKKKKKKE